MIDWKRRALELAEVVDRHRKDRMVNDKKLAWEIAHNLLKQVREEDKARALFLKYWREKDKVKAQEHLQEYLEIIRSYNDRPRAVGK